LNYKDNKDDAINWLKSFKSPYEISIHDFYGTLALDLGVTGAPETYLLKDGIIVRRHIGELNIEKWRQDFADFF
jgi:cytochrome c biogenesis protein CcmG/thiol:disulfide interchange protein DsbE